MGTPTNRPLIEHRSPAELDDRRLLAIIAFVAILLVATMAVQGASHDALHDVRHVAAVACH